MKKIIFLLIIFSLVFILPAQPSFAAGNPTAQQNIIFTTFKIIGKSLTSSFENVLAFFSSHQQTGNHNLAIPPDTTPENKRVQTAQGTNTGSIPGVSQQGSGNPTAVTFSTFDTTSVNLLQNASFEQQSSGQPNSWNYQLDSNTGNTFLSQEGIRSGSYGLKFLGGGTGNFGISQPNTETVSGRTYTLSAYIKYTNAPRFTVRLGFWNDHLNQEGDIKTFTFSGTSDWTRISTTTTTPGLITDSRNEFPLIEVEGLTTGAVYLDDSQLEEGSVLTDYNSAQAYTSSYGIGDGSILFSTGGNILPAIPGTGSLGTTTNQFQSLNLTNANIDSNGNFTFNGSGTVKGGLTVNGTLSFNGATGSGTFTNSLIFSAYGTGILHSSSNGTITSSAVNLANGDITGILGVSNGGTGSSNGSIAGTSELDFSSGGSNQNIVLTPSGSGFVILNGNVGIGTTNPFTPLHIEATATDTSQGSSLLVDGTLASGTNSQAAIASQPNVIPDTTSNRTYDGIYSQPYLDTNSLTNGTVEGINAGVQYNGSGTLGTVNGGYFQNVNNSTGTITTSDGLYIDNPTNNGTITNNYGLYIANLTAGSTNYAIYSAGGLTLFKSSITPSGSDIFANDLQMSVPSAFTSASANGLRIKATDSVASGTTNWVTGLKLDYAKTGNSTTNTAIGAWAPFELGGGTGTVTNGASLETQLYLYANGTISSYKGLYVAAPSFNGCSTNCGTVTNLYGLRIDAQKVTGVTNAYGVYQNGASDLNYFAGNVGIGTNNPSSFALQAAGNVGPNATDTYNLGSASDEWNNIYVKNIISSASSGQNGYWQLNSGVLSPATITNTLAIGQTTALANSGLDIEQNGLGNSIFVANQKGSGDIFTASQSGSTKLVINNSGNVGIGITNPTSLLHLSTSITPSGSDIYAANVAVSVPTAFGSNGAYGLSVRTQDTVASGTTNWVTSEKIDYQKWSNSTTNTAIDSWMPFELAGGTGTVTSGTSLETQLYLYANATLNSYKGLYVAAPSFNGCSTNCGTVTNLYGLKIDAQKVTGVNNAFGVYQAGTSDQNYFAGTTGLGTTLVGNAQLVVNQPNSSGDIFSASQSGSTKFVINNSGNVGIGTNNSSAPLQIGSDSSSTPGVLVGAGGANTNYLSVSGGRAMFGYDAGTSNLALNAGSAKGLEFYTNGTNGTFLSGTAALVINTSGNVGIGTTSPNSPLHILNSSAGATTTALTLGNAFGTNNSGTQINFNLSGTNSTFTADIAAVRTNSPANAGTYLSFGTNPGTGNSGTNEVLRLSEFGGAGFQTSAIGNGAMAVNQPNSAGDIFAASQSGSTKFRIDNSGSVTETGNENVNGGSILTTASTFNLVNATPTTINFGGAATALNIGASTGSTTIFNNLVLNNNSAATTFGGIAYTWPTSGQSNGFVLTTNGSGTLSWTANGGGYWQLNSGVISPATQTNKLSVGTTGSLATLDARALSGTVAVASISGQTSFAALTVDNSGVGDLFTASSSGQSRFDLNQSGNVGLNTASPTNRLTVNKLAVTSASTALAQEVIGTGADANIGLIIEGNSSGQTGDLMRFKNGTGGDVVSIGSAGLISTNDRLKVGNVAMPAGYQIYSAPGASNVGLAVFANAAQTADLLQLQNNSSTVLDTFSASGQLGVGTNLIGNAEVTISQPNSSGNIFSASQSGTTVFNIDNSGNTRITSSLCVKATFSTSCAGSTAGTIYATNTTVQSADVAENYISSQTLEPGDVIMPAQDGNNQAVIKTTIAYQSQAIGIVSTNPGVTLNSDATPDSTHPNKYPVALQGRVPIKVSSINGNVQAGDLLTTSSIPGVAQKATQAGTIIGKALESFSSSNPNEVAKIMTFVNVSFSDPAITITASGNLAVNGRSIDNTMPNTSSLVSTESVLAPNTQNTPTSVTSDQFNQLSSAVLGFQSEVASWSAQISKIDDLSKQLNDLEKTVNLTQTLQGTGTSSAGLGTSTSTDDTTIGGALNVLGRTVLSDLGVTGTIDTGLLSINGMDTATGTASATINTLSAPLKFQSLATAGVDFENGRVTIDTNGSLVTTGDITAKTINAVKINLKDNGDTASVGDATIPAGQTSTVVKTTAVTDRSKVFVTSESPLESPLFISHKKSGESFTVETLKAAPQEVKFNWWIVN